MMVSVGCCGIVTAGMDVDGRVLEGVSGAVHPPRMNIKRVTPRSLIVLIPGKLFLSMGARFQVVSARCIWTIEK
jgi:hypothetical protein